MFLEKPTAKCRVVQKVTESGTFYCLRPAHIFLISNSPEPLVLCVECARELAKEIIDSFHSGSRDANLRTH